MKIRLLSDDGYMGMDNVKFPVEVDAEVDGICATVPESELHRIGCAEEFEDPDDPFWPFYGSSWEKAE